MKKKTKRQMCAEWVGHAPQGETALQPPMPRPPRPGYAWDMHRNEVRLVQAGRHKLQRRADVLIEEQASDRIILTGEEHGDNE